LARLQGFADDYTFHSEGGNVKTVCNLFSGLISTHKTALDASADWKCCGMACIDCNWPTVYTGTSTPQKQLGTGGHHWQSLFSMLTFATYFDITVIEMFLPLACLWSNKF
jgi:hypothetical protein